MIPGVTNVNCEISTNCDRRCPNCCAGIGINRTLQHHPWEYFETAAKVLHGIDRVCLNGGEPTFHPQFGEFAPKFKELFGCRTLAMTTDGWGVLKYFDVISATFTPRDKLGPGGPCERAWWRSSTIAYADGRIFGCCVAPGIEGAASVLPIVGERFDVPNPPCEKCWWSE